MKDCSQDLISFHDDDVTLDTAIQTKMRTNRNANRDRLQRGLERNEKPNRDYYIIQGSYAMKTMVQHPDNDYDIDDGVLFSEKKLKDRDGGALTPKDVKEMVRDALVEGGGLATTPKVRNCCVRVDYAAGHHIDIPVYRIIFNQEGEEIRRELAGTEWRESDPEKITKWFREEEKRSKIESENESQLRRMVRLLKAYARQNEGDNALSGLILTILATEKHTYYKAREDIAFRDLLGAVKARLLWNREVKNPTDAYEVLTKEADGEKIDAFDKCIAASLERLKSLDNANCTVAEARKTWDDVFKTGYFSKLQDNDKTAALAPYTPSPTEPKSKVSLSGPGTSA